MNEHKVCYLITGASRGIGRAIASTFAKDGHVVTKHAQGSKMFLIARDCAGLEKTKSQISNECIDVQIISADLARDEDVKKATDQAFQFLGQRSSYDMAVLVHNAANLGNVSDSAYASSDLSYSRHYFDLNLTSVIGLTAIFCEQFKGVKCLVVNISSLAASQPLAYAPLYCTGKAARYMYFRCLAADNPDITVLNYGPGPVDTDMAAELRDGSGSLALRKMFVKMFEENTIIQPVATSEKLARILREGLFKSGDHVDFFDAK